MRIVAIPYAARAAVTAGTDGPEVSNTNGRRVIVIWIWILDVVRILDVNNTAVGGRSSLLLNVERCGRYHDDDIDAREKRDEHAAEAYSHRVRLGFPVAWLVD